MSRPSVVVHQVQKSFRDLLVLRDISFEVKSAELFCIFGSSGCGKTTLLKILAGLETADGGTITIEGVDITKEPHRSVEMASVVWQDPRLAYWRTVEENLTLALKLKFDSGELGPEAAEDRIHKALDFVGLSPYRRFFPRELSGGMRQRVNLARALVLDAPIMLMDEPLASLNEITDKRQLIERVLALWERERKTIIYVTHSLEEALTLADRIATFSEKPTTVLRLEEVNLPRPRDRDDRAFRELYKKISSSLLSPEPEDEFSLA